MKTAEHTFREKKLLLQYLEIYTDQNYITKKLNYVYK